MICRADHQRTVTMHQILEIRSSFADWLLPPPMYDDESLGDYIIHVQCLPSCREQSRNNESSPIASFDWSPPNHIAVYSPPGTCHTRDKPAITSVLNANCCAQQTGMHKMVEATVLLSIYLRSELTLIDTRVLSARCPLADVPGSACETPSPRHHAAT
jgi:hypothetical protein